MTTTVLGAGVIGLATAYALYRDGHEVRIVERLEGPGLATSFGNAGGLCPGFAGPWAAPGMVRKALGWMFQASAPLKIRPRIDVAQWSWLMRFARECEAGRSAANKRAMQAIAHYSQERLQALASETGVDFDHGKGGVLQTFRSETSLQSGRRAASVLEGLGIAHRLIEPHEIAQIEPALAGSAARFAGALHLPDDQTGDCAAFCRELAGWLAERGVRFSYGIEATGLRVEGGRVSAIETASEPIATDRVVLAAGPFANALLAPLGVRQPLYPVKGYSLTYALDDTSAGPRSSVVDEDSKLMFTRLGDRVRVGGVAELAGFDTRLAPAQINAIRSQTEMLFPALQSGADPTPWCGFRPMTPDGRARIGPVRGIEGLWVNLGHGSNGWTQAAGAGQVLADLVARREPAIDPSPYRTDLP